MAQTQDHWSGFGYEQYPPPTKTLDEQLELLQKWMGDPDSVRDMKPIRSITIRKVRKSNRK